MSLLARMASAQQLRRLYPLMQVLNAIGTVWGFVWYAPSLRGTPTWLLPFVPDCPLAALLMLAALWQWRCGRSEALQGAAIGIALFYAFWTIVLLAGAGPVPDGALLLAAHVGLASEALWLWSVAMPQRGWRIAALWVALNTFADYILGVHPPLPEGVPLTAVALLTALGALAFAALAPVLEPAG